MTGSVCVPGWCSDVDNSLLAELFDHMLLEVARPVRCKSAGTTSLAKLQRAFEMTDLHTEARECREGVDDKPTAVAGVVIALLGIRPLLNGTVDADRACHPFVLPPRMRLAGF